MKIRPFTIGALGAALSLASAALGAYATAELVLGDGTGRGEELRFAIPM